MKNKFIGFTLLSVLLATITNLQAEGDSLATLRNATAIADQKPTPSIAKTQNSDVKQVRSYPMQPPLIPHTVRNYEINLNSNKCMSCHSRQRIRESQAPMVSVTHFMDREGNFLAEISPRRYFCNQCHVTQSDAKPLVENTFVDMHTLINMPPEQ